MRERMDLITAVSTFRKFVERKSELEGDLGDVWPMCKDDLLRFGSNGLPNICGTISEQEATLRKYMLWIM